MNWIGFAVDDGVFDCNCDRDKYVVKYVKDCIAEKTGINPYSADINAVRARFLELFHENPGYELPQTTSFTPITGIKKANKLTCHCECSETHS